MPASVTIAAGATATSFEVTAVVDAEADAGERLTLSFGERPPGIAEGDPATATITIQEAPAAAPPEFGAAGYAFTVAEDAAVGTVVGTVAATAAAPVTYALTAGNAAGAFALNATSGALTVAAALDTATTAAYTLTVTASADGAAATVAVAITVTPGAATAPPAPTSLTAGTVTATSVPLTWAAVPGAATYRVESRVRGTETWTTADDTLTEASHTVAGLTCATTYDFRVSASGDGTAHTATWGQASGALTATTGACPLPAPAAPTSLAAGTVTATSVPLTWAAVPGAATYRVEARISGLATWTTDADTLTTVTHTVAGLTCATAYAFRVSAFGDGASRAAAWGAASAAATATTGACSPLSYPTVAFAQAVSQLREGTSATVTVTLSSASARAVTIPLTVTPRTAARTDAAGIPASVTIAAGATAASFQVTAVQDQLDEPTAEMLFLAFGELPAGLAAGQPARHLLVISDGPAG